jgi:ppGpp synthetase/RelA/SpoT-type nucleotidyltranferase
MERLLSKLMQADNIRVHVIESRVKSRESLRMKLSRRDSRYRRQADVTDVIGVRVISLFSDDVDCVADLIKREFAVDEEHSADKRLATDPDRFGYQSLHFVVGLSPARAGLPEYREFKGLKAEIQVRSILQHAWAEIEHDLGYKASEEIPIEFRRQFSRNAGLLETADWVFVSVRKGLAEYDKVLVHKTQESPESVALDLNSVSAFIKQSSLIKELDEAIAGHYGAPVSFNTDSVAHDVLRLKKAGFRSLSEVSSELSRLARVIPSFETKEYESSPENTGDVSGVTSGISLLYLTYAVLAEKSDTTILRELTGESDPERIVEAFRVAMAATTSVKK